MLVFCGADFNWDLNVKKSNSNRHQLTRKTLHGNRLWSRFWLEYRVNINISSSAEHDWPRQMRPQARQKYFYSWFPQLWTTVGSSQAESCAQWAGRWWPSKCRLLFYQSNDILVRAQPSSGQWLWQQQELLISAPTAHYHDSSATPPLNNINLLQTEMVRLCLWRGGQSPQSPESFALEFLPKYLIKNIWLILRPVTGILSNHIILYLTDGLRKTFNIGIICWIFCFPSTSYYFDFSIITSQII